MPPKCFLGLVTGGGNFCLLRNPLFLVKLKGLMRNHDFQVNFQIYMKQALYFGIKVPRCHLFLPGAVATSFSVQRRL